MTYEELEQAVQVHFRDNVFSVPVVYDNIAQDIDAKSLWSRLTIEPTTSENLGIGSKRTIKDGNIVLQVFAPIDSGTRASVRVVDEFLALFENTELDCLVFFYEGEMIRIGDEGNGWYQLNAEVRFQAT